MDAVRSVLLLLMLLAITLALLLTGAAGVGVLLHRLMPGVGLETGVLIGVVALSVSLHFVLGLLGKASSLREELDEAEIEDVMAAIHHRAHKSRSRR